MRRTGRPFRDVSLVVLALAPALVLAIPTAASAREPTELEQYIVELINRARANPAAEVDRYATLEWGDDGTAAPDLNEGIAPGTISADPKQPLAISTVLTDAASDYTDVQWEADTIGHEYGGTNPESRMEAAGYAFVPSWTYAENLAVTASSLPFPANAERVEDQHRGLFIDAGIAERGHRENLMNGALREIGVGIRDGGGYGYFPCCPNAILMTQDFAMSSYARAFLTGVVYRDVDGNDFYTPDAGEPLGPLTVEIVHPATGEVTAATTTFASGGYSLQQPPDAGVYDVRFVSGDGVATYPGIMLPGTQNVKLDAIDPEFQTVFTADISGDGFVDRIDAAVLLRHLGVASGAVFAGGDLDDDAAVTLADLALLQSHLDSPSGAPAAARVPEPGSMSLAAAAILTALAGPLARRRQKPRIK